MSLPRFGVTKPVPVNLLMMAAIIAGVTAAFTLRREFFPETTPEQALVSLPYPGATPAEIEESMGRKVEDALADLKEVERMTTTISEGGGGIIVEFREGVNIDKGVREVEKAVDALMDLPEDAEEIVVTEFEPRLPAIMVTVYGEADEEVMKRAIRRVRDDLKSLPGMGEIIFTGTRRYEVRVDVNEAALIEHAISLPQISDAIRAWMSDSPGGTVRTAVGNINVRTMGVPERAEAIRQIVVRATASGQALRVGDIASVREDFVDDQIIRRFNGKSAVSLTVFKTGDQDAVQIAKMARAYAAGRRGDPFTPTLVDRFYEVLNRDKKPHEARLRTERKIAYDLGVATSALEPLPGHIATHSDLARFIEGRLDLLSRNALQGAILVFITLLIFLNWRAAFWVMTGLVTALCGTLVVMGVMGITLNLLTMFGLIIVVGMLVDDAIVVAENIQSRHDRGETPLDAAIKGAEEVLWPVVGTVTTTIVAFIPLTFVKGRMGDLLGALPWVVACALAASMIEVILILPSHMGHSLIKRDRLSTERVSVARRFEKVRDQFLNTRVLPAYERLLRVLLEYRYITTAAVLALLIISIGMVSGRRLEFVFMDTSDSETIMVDLRMPIGTPLAATEAIARQIEAAAVAQPDVKSVSLIAGQRSNIDTGTIDANATHIAQLFMELVPVEQRDRESSKIIESMRRHHGFLHAAEQVRYSEIGGAGAGPDITIQVKGEDDAAVNEVVAGVRHALAQREGVYDIADDNYNSQRELQIVPKPHAPATGLSKRDIDEQVRGALYGLEAHTFSAHREDIDVRVRLDEQSRRTLGTIDNMWIVGAARDGASVDTNPSAARAPSRISTLVPLREIADLREGVGFSTIRRIDRQRAVTVTADTAPQVSPETIMRDIQPELARLAQAHPSVIIDVGGRQRDLAKAFGSLPLGMGAAVLMIYVILAWLFSSYIQPLVVMLAIPFGVVGVVWGHTVFGYRATFLSMIGFIALCGIVVNNSLILMEFFNAARRSGLPLREALLQAGKQRLRPIVLTSITTFLGLTPLMLEQSFQARFLIPMAISISFGLLSSTVLVLTALPCFMVIVDDLKAAIYYLWFGRPRPSQDAPPASAQIASEAE